ncbi:MAG: ketopantoate reductase C-terminal domain-containing protein, partial [Candidatus Binataceae bacterium]
IAEMLTTAGIPTRACADIMPILWTKLLYNAALNPLGALLELHYGAIGEAPELRAIMDRVIDEAFAVARRLEVALPFADSAEYKALFYGRLIPSTYDHRPTMLGDLRRRGRTEIGALNGKLVEFADRLGLEADANRALLSLIRASERIRQLPIIIAGRDARATMTSEDNRAFRVSRAAMDAIVAQGEREFPYECCGFIIGNEAIEEVRPVTNIQNRMHAAEPAAYRRDARTAFLMEPKEHLAVLREADDRKLVLKAVYHSHPDHDAYFSATDRAQACSFDPNEPDYPATAYVVLSIKSGKFARAAAFVWDPARREFVETPLAVV